MLYLAIPAHNEAATIGVLLWRLRTVLAEFPREYEAVVYDDASSDSTSEILESYTSVMPLTVLRGERRVGYAGAVDALARHVSRQTRYPRRDAMLLLQGDFTDPPALVPEFVKRFEGGADIVVGERVKKALRTAPTSVRRLVRATPWLLRFFVGVEGVRDLTSSYRLVRISVLRDLLRAAGDAPVCSGDATTANADLLLKLVPLARRVESLEVEPTWEVRLRDSRVVAMSDGLALFRWGWRSRGRRSVPSTLPEAASDSPRATRGNRNDRDSRGDSRHDARPELRVESRTELIDDGGVDGAEPMRHNRRDRTTRSGRNDRPVRNADRSNERTTDRNADRTAERNVDRNVDRNAERKAARNATRETARVVPDDAPVARAETVEGAPGVEKPARRKRTRGRRGDRAAKLGSSVDADENSATSRELHLVDNSDSDADNVVEQDFALADGDAPASDSVAELPPLSAALNDAVDDAETSLDDPRKFRPARKKRRRRGGRRQGAREGGDERGADAADPTGSESGVPASGREPESDDDSSGDSEPEGQDAGGAAEGDAEAKVRRRGRRGRRGGSRRGRQRAEGGAAGAGVESEFRTPSDNASPPVGGDE